MTQDDQWRHLYEDAKDFDTPVELSAEVVHGFNRGSKELGIPTANLSMEELGPAGEELETGIYYGMATLKGERYKTVVSVGWNPFYKNVQKTIEAHLLAKLDDFYGEHLQLSLVGYLRKETSFYSLDELISCINSDIRVALSQL